MGPYISCNNLRFQVVSVMLHITEVDLCILIKYFMKKCCEIAKQNPIPPIPGSATENQNMMYNLQWLFK